MQIRDLTFIAKMTFLEEVGTIYIILSISCKSLHAGTVIAEEMFHCDVIFIYVELDYRCVYYSILLRDVSAYGEGRAGRVGKGGFLGRRVRP